MSHSLRIALLGCGTVGTAVAKSLLTRTQQLNERAGHDLQLVGIAVNDLDKQRDPSIPRELLTRDAACLAQECDIFVEVAGGIEPTQTLIRTAMSNGASIVTANKTLVAEHGPELSANARDSNVIFSYEAAVAGAIPLIRPIQTSLAGDSIQRVLGIVNGTTNYILDQMHTHSLSQADALAQAQELGFAEADPTADVEGHDAASKAAILASLSFDYPVSAQQVFREGITGITAADVQAAKTADQVIKLLATCEKTLLDGKPVISARVHPALVHKDHPLASVRGGMNAVFIEAEAAGPLMFYGAGAGAAPTASAVLGDLVCAARCHGSDIAAQQQAPAKQEADLLSIDEVSTRYHVRLEAEDRIGVLSDVAGVFAQHNVSLQSVHQPGQPLPTAGETQCPVVTLFGVTHTAREKDIAKAVQTFESSPGVQRVASVLRVEGEY